MLNLGEHGDPLENARSGLAYPMDSRESKAGDKVSNDLLWRSLVCAEVDGAPHVVPWDY